MWSKEEVLQIYVLGYSPVSPLTVSLPLSEPSLCSPTPRWPASSCSSCRGCWGGWSCPSALQCAPAAGATVWWTAPYGTSHSCPQACSTTFASSTSHKTGRKTSSSLSLSSSFSSGWILALNVWVLSSNMANSQTESAGRGSK